MVRHITQLYPENNEELYAYATFIGEPPAYVLNALIERSEGRQGLPRVARREHRSHVCPCRARRSAGTRASYHARTSAGRAGMVTLPQGV